MNTYHIKSIHKYTKMNINEIRIEDAPEESELLDAKNELDRDFQQNIGLLDEHLIFFYKLQYKTDVFEQALSARADIDQIKISIDNTHMHAAILDDNVVIDRIFKAEWTFLAQYGFNAHMKNYYFIWATKLIPEPNSDLLQAREKFPDETNVLAKKDILTFSDPMIISYIQGVLCEIMDFDYIKITQDENEIFSMFGLKKIEWFNQIIEPVSEI